MQELNRQDLELVSGGKGNPDGFFSKLKFYSYNQQNAAEKSGDVLGFAFWGGVNRVAVPFSLFGW